MARRSLKLPIILGVVMITLAVVLIVGWVMLTVLGALADDESAGLYWALLSIGTVVLVLMIVGVSIYLGLSVKAINLNRRQSNFIDSVTHELKSPIASLKLYLQTLDRRQVSAEELQSFCQFMLADVARLERLINHVLDAARLEHGDVARPTESIELVPLVEECAETVRQRYRAPPEALRLDLAPCAVRADRHDLELVFRNLMDNALKYAGDPAEVLVNLRQITPDRIMFRVSDNGRGIPQSMRRRIFGRFERLGLEIQRTRPGTGLGLYIVRTIVRQLRGDVRVRDPVAGPGTIFEVELPAAPVAASMPEDLSTIDDVHSTVHDGRAVEDNSLTRAQGVRP